MLLRRLGRFSPAELLDISSTVLRSEVLISNMLGIILVLMGMLLPCECSRVAFLVTSDSIEND